MIEIIRQLLLISYLYQTIQKQKISHESKYNHKHENQVVLIMITNGEKWHNIALKSVRTTDEFNRPIRSLSRLFRGITANNNRDFYCLGCLDSF